jgi:hypothetical protein
MTKLAAKKSPFGILCRLFGQLSDPQRSIRSRLKSSLIQDGVQDELTGLDVLFHFGETAYRTRYRAGCPFVTVQTFHSVVQLA